MIIILSGVLLLVLYIVRITAYSRTWHKSPSFDSALENSRSSISVVIAFRNEEEYLPAMLESIRKQNIAPSRFEVILVDDHSVDGSFLIAEKFCKKNSHFRLLKQNQKFRGKKAAINLGIEAAENELIVTSDADCLFGERWLEEMTGFYDSGNFRLISGPVKMIPGKDFFSKFQSLEFLSLMGTGGASFLRKKPVMCNAANLCFEKSLYLEAELHLKRDFPSGDDIFLMLYTKKYHPGRMGFIKSRGSIVSTKAEKDMKAFLSQRSRWSSKAPLYRDANLVYLSLLVLLFNLNLFILMIASFFEAQYFFSLLSILLFKFETDYAFLKKISRFTTQEKLLKIFLPSQIIYPFYILTAAFSGIIRFKNQRS